MNPGVNLEGIRLLYDYNAWANNRTLESCATLSDEEFSRDLSSSFRSVRDTLVHIFWGEWLWLERWHGRSPTAMPAAADFPNLAAVRTRMEGIDRELIDFVSGLEADGLARIVEHKTTAGVPQAQPLWHMLQHLANHGTYHRGQVATMLRQLGAKPQATDLILFYRQRAAPASA
jgi:uncharacterized damage-inducible protein DinB